MRKPDVFIAGAPKCGTTALATYLDDREDVFFCKPKEPSFFADDLAGNRYVDDLGDYLGLFEGAGEAAVVGEASAWYMYSEAAAANIRAFAPDARIIIMVRNPLELAPSLHSQLLFNFDEDESSFERAWRLEARRLEGRALPPRCTEPKLLRYSRTPLLGKQLSRYLEAFPREQLHFILFEDFKADTGGEFEKVLAFLGLPSEGRNDFPPVNVAKRRRLERASRFIAKPPEALVTMLKAGKRLLGIRGPLGVAKLAERNLSVEMRAARPEGPFREELSAHFKEDVELLSNLLERDLGHWLK